MRPQRCATASVGPCRPQPQRRCRTRGVLGANAVPRATSLAQRLGRSGLQPSPPGPSALCAWWAGPSSLFRQLQGGQCPSGQEEGPLRAGQGAHPTAPSPQPHGHPGSHVTSTDTPASCPCVRPRGDRWPVSLGQVRPGAVCAVAVPADPLRGLLRPRHPAAYGEQPPGWGQSRRRGLGAGGSSAWGV